MPDSGYAGKIIKIDLSDGKVSEQPTSEYADRFIGGKGLAARLYLEAVPPGAGPWTRKTAWCAPAAR